MVESLSRAWKRHEERKARRDEAQNRRLKVERLLAVGLYFSEELGYDVSWEERDQAKATALVSALLKASDVLG